MVPGKACRRLVILRPQDNNFPLNITLSLARLTGMIGVIAELLPLVPDDISENSVLSRYGIQSCVHSGRVVYFVVEGVESAKEAIRQGLSRLAE